MESIVTVAYKKHGKVEQWNTNTNGGGEFQTTLVCVHGESVGKVAIGVLTNLIKSSV